MLALPTGQGPAALCLWKPGQGVKESPRLTAGVVRAGAALALSGCVGAPPPRAVCAVDRQHSAGRLLLQLPYHGFWLVTLN